MRMNKNEAIFSKEAILYSPNDLNIIISVLLSDLVSKDFCTDEVALTAKTVFNDLMGLIVNNKEIADSILSICEEEDANDETYSEDDDLEDWNAVSAADKIRIDTLLS